MCSVFQVAGKIYVTGMVGFLCGAIVSLSSGKAAKDSPYCYCRSGEG